MKKDEADNFIIHNKFEELESVMRSKFSKWVKGWL
jgi:hypothetical protein